MPLRAAESVQSIGFRQSVLLGKHTLEGLFMEQLEIVDLGDVMTETQCSLAFGPYFDFLYGAGHTRC